MRITLDYKEHGQKGRIQGSPQMGQAIWSRITALASRVQPDLLITGRDIEMDWSALLSMAARLSDLRTQYGFAIEYTNGARQQLIRYRQEYDSLRKSSPLPSVTEDTVQSALNDLGFSRTLKQPQRRDLVRLISNRHGANFSVPGAGKTTVAFAAYLLTSTEDTFLLVVAPKNAFSAWDDVIPETLDKHHPKADMTRFVRLEGGTDAIQTILRATPKRIIISYDQLIRVIEVIADFLRKHRVHMIVDESHKMKSGEYSQRGTALLSIAHLPTRRDILSGTPIPNSLADIVPQIDFTWPGQGIGRRIMESLSPSEILRPLYARTRKHELDLPPIERRYIPVQMSSAQLGLYSLVRDATLQRLVGVTTSASIDLQTARTAVIRLLQISSNPILAVRGMTEDQMGVYEHDDTTLEALFTRIVEERDSPKLLKAVETAKDILAANKTARVVIWSSFRDNVERIAELLSEYGATYIHGLIPIGDSEDANTREGRLKLFHSSDFRCRVLVANPAACSEGISLHRVCHHAIYVDRSYNAAHYLQSVDRIHRLGLEDNTCTYIYIIESIAPSVIGAIDYSVRRRMILKLNMMSSALEDVDLQRLALDEQEGDEPIDYDISPDDIVDLICELSGTAVLPNEE